jgi:Ser/Thr protein kinase RdoA (MazF antagonist)
VAPAPDFSAEQVKDVADQLYGLDGVLYPLDSERDQNFRISTENGDHFVVKITNRAEDPAVTDMQVKALEHIASVDPGLPVPRILLSRTGLALEQIRDEQGTNHWMRILTYMLGAHPKDDPTEQALFRPIGACLARTVLALRGFIHPAANHELLWDLKHSSKLRHYLPCIQDENHRELVSHFLNAG